MPMPDAMTAALQRAAAEEAEVQWGEPISAEDLALPLKSASRASEDRIWLQATCDDGCERCWADHDFGPCEVCDLPCVAYVREGEAERQLAEVQSERNELAAQIEEWGAEKEAACMRAEVAERQLAEALGQLGAEHAAHLATGKWLADTEHLLRTILDAEQHFRNALPEEWDGDPIHDACEAARAALPDEPLWTNPHQP